MSELMTTDVGATQPQTMTTTGAFDFNQALDASYRENPSITKFGGDVNKLANSYLELQAFMGKNKVVIPKDETDLSAWDMYDKAFGIPATAGEYELSSANDFDLTEFKALMKANHISPSVAQKLLDAHLNEFQKLDELKQEQALADRQQAEKDLRKEWGMKYQENIDNATHFLRNVSGNQEDFEYFKDKIGNDTKFIKLLARMGEQTSEGSLGGIQAGQVRSFNKTPADAKAEFDQILNDPNDIYWAGSKNKRNDLKWCKEHNQQYVSEQERKARVAYVDSLVQMMKMG